MKETVSLGQAVIAAEAVLPVRVLEALGDFLQRDGTTRAASQPLGVSHPRFDGASTAVR